MKLNSKIEAINSHIDEELGSLQKSVHFMTKDFDLFKKALDDVQKELHGPKAENARLVQEN